MGVSIKKAHKKQPLTVSARPRPNIRTQVTREHSNMRGERVEQVLKDVNQPVEIPDKEYTQPVANVGFNCRMTKNLGDFNSLQVGVSLHLPCYVNEIDETYNLAKEFVESKLNETLDEYADITPEDFEE
ncbi:hypothetical protein NVP1215B_097 [Vibrio phage 1.215.B._10N.222.54.F7]|nr:hypothetical protein NVP1215A_097 [Vibrio phage 1.215.A._10N.222.54.F7]AUR96120.1 hypothetical protein NVP1215B_097 [Vibrio phage 1.215.B._10N.222.54.F7]